MSKINNVISNGQIQRHFYKYKPLNEYAEEMLTTGLVYFNKAEEFNDPYELQIEDSGIYTKNDVINYFKNNSAEKMSDAAAIHLADDVCKQHPNIGEFLKKILEQTKKHSREKAGILCLAKSFENILMWAHYADSHRGFALEVDISVLEDRFFPLKVRYEKNIPHMEYLKDPNEFFINWALTKSTHWEYEEEYRMIIRDCSKQRKFLFPKQSFSKVYWGLNVDLKKRDEIIAKMKENGFPTEFYQEKLNQQSYQVIFEKI